MQLFGLNFVDGNHGARGPEFVRSRVPLDHAKRRNPKRCLLSSVFSGGNWRAYP